MELIPHCLTPELCFPEIRSLIGFGNLVGPLVHSVLYPQEKTLEAAPQSISERTSYHGV